MTMSIIAPEMADISLVARRGENELSTSTRAHVLIDAGARLLVLSGRIRRYLPGMADHYDFGVHLVVVDHPRCKALTSNLIDCGAFAPRALSHALVWSIQEHLLISASSLVIDKYMLSRLRTLRWEGPKFQLVGATHGSKEDREVCSQPSSGLDEFEPLGGGGAYDAHW